MKCSPIFHCGRRTAGFTLVEVLTATLVTAFMMIMLGQILATASGSWREGQKRINNFMKGRAMLETLARDLQLSVRRDDLAIFPDSAAAFYTRRPGLPAGEAEPRGISLVAYRIDPASADSALQRADLAVGWSDAADLISFGEADQLPLLSGTTPRHAAAGVVGFELLFLDSEGNFSPRYAGAAGAPARAVGVSLAIVDDWTMRQLTPGQASALRRRLKAAVSGTRSVKAEWEEFLQGSMDWSAFPGGLASGLRIFERYVELPPS